VCEDGEGITPSDRDNPAFLDRIKDTEIEVSTEVEVMAENPHVVNILLGVVERYQLMEPAPDIDTKKRTRKQVDR
jgi:hypothetical protein